MAGTTESRTDNAKLREAVHFVCKKMALEPHKLGAVKLQKIIWYFDVRSYLVSGQTATGAVFVKGQHGPYTKEITAVLEGLAREHRLFMGVEEFHNNEKARLVGKGHTDLSVFSEKEKRWLDEIATDVCENHTAASISERSHGPIWRMAAFGETIPFAATALRLRRPSPEALASIRDELGLA